MKIENQEIIDRISMDAVEILDGHFTVCNSGRVLLDTSAFFADKDSDNPDLFCLTIYKTDADFCEVCNASYIDDFCDFENYKLENSEYYTTREEMMVRYFELQKEYCNYF